MDFKERGNKLEISVEEAIKDLQEDIAEKQNQIELIKNID